MRMKHLIGLLALTTLLHTNALASDTPVLTSEGLPLGRLSATDVSNGLAVKVDLKDDDVKATYVTARFQNNAPRQRTASGYWQLWNERWDTLQDNAFTATEDGTLTFQVIDENLSENFLPIVFTVAYRTEDGVKSGYVVID